jgi:hypothetical protein
MRGDGYYYQRHKEGCPKYSAENAHSQTGELAGRPANSPIFQLPGPDSNQRPSG